MASKAGQGFGLLLSPLLSRGKKFPSCKRGEWVAGQHSGSSWKGKRQQQAASMEMALLEVPTGVMCVDKCWQGLGGGDGDDAGGEVAAPLPRFSCAIGWLGWLY